jgi:streptogramin lyase
MTMTKKAIFAISLLLATIIVAPASCAQDSVSANPSSASDYTGFLRPSGIAVDTIGNIYVTSNFNSIWEFSPSGDVITHWGSSGSGEGQFDRPVNIAIDYQGFIYVTDRDNARIQKFSSSGIYISQWDCLKYAPTKSSPECRWNLRDLGGIATSNDGNLYIVQPNNYVIVKITPDGKYLADWGSKGTEKGQLNMPTDIAVDREGNIFVTDLKNSRVQKFSASGTFLTSFGSAGTGDGQFSTPYGIGVDRKGFVYVTDTGLNRVQKFTNAGTFVGKWGTVGTNDGEFANPLDVAVDSNDNVYVTDLDNNCIQKFTADGLFLMKWCGSPEPSQQIPRQTPKLIQTWTSNPNRTLSACEDETWMNVTAYLLHVNEELHWGFSDEQINQYSEKVQNTIDKKYVTSKNNIHLCNFSQLGSILQDTVGITEEQHLSLLYYEQKEIGCRMGYMEIKDFKCPETIHFVINGRVTDPEGRPVPAAVVKYESNLVIKKTLMNLVNEDTRLFSTTRTSNDGTYHINVVWGDRQNASVTKEGYLNNTRDGITLTNQSNTIDFQLTPLARQTTSAPGFLVFPVVTAVMLAYLIADRKRQ